ncbi:MAG: sialidase family protein [bacterium]
MKHYIVCKHKNRYFAFPDISEVSKGLYAIVFRDAPHRTRGHTHIDPDSHVAVITSDKLTRWDAGEKLTIPRTRGAGQLPSVVATGDGEVLLLDFRWKVSNRLHGEDVYLIKNYNWRVRFDGTYAVRMKWKRNKFIIGKPLVIEPQGWKNMAGSSRALILPDGRIFYPVDAEYPGTGMWAVLILCSADKGATWEVHSRVAAGPVPGVERLCEPSIVRTASGKMLCLMRALSEEDHLYQCRSADGGKSWTAPQKTPIKGHPPFLLRLRDGRLLALYGYRHSPYGIRACVSEDNGKSWDIAGEIVIRSDGAGADIGYPRGLELADGRIAAVYYFQKKDGIRYIALSVFNLD